MPVNEDRNPAGVVPASASNAFGEKQLSDEAFVAAGAGPGVPVNVGALLVGVPNVFYIKCHQ